MIFTKDLKDEIPHCVRNDIIWHQPGTGGIGLTCEGPSRDLYVFIIMVKIKNVLLHSLMWGDKDYDKNYFRLYKIVIRH